MAPGRPLDARCAKLLSRIKEHGATALVQNLLASVSGSLRSERSVLMPRLAVSRSRALGLVAAVLSIVLGSNASLGDANSREGCMNQWLFNGVWRVRITAVEPYMNGNQQQGWQVTEVWRNGTSQGLSPFDSQLKDQRLELQNGAITATQLGVAFNTFAPAGEFTYKQVFLASNLSADASNKPKGLKIMFDGAMLAQQKSKPQ